MSIYLGKIFRVTVFVILWDRMMILFFLIKMGNDTKTRMLERIGGMSMIQKLRILLQILIILGCGTPLWAYTSSDLVDDRIFNRKIKDLLKVYNIPSVQAVILKKDKNGMWQQAWSGAYGYRQAIYPKRKADENTIYPIGSITKTFIAAAVMQLVEKGLLDLDTPLNKPGVMPISITNPYFQNSPLTIRHLLNHRGGIAYLDASWLAAPEHFNFTPYSPFGKSPAFELGVPYPLLQKRDGGGKPINDDSLEFYLKELDENNFYTFWANIKPDSQFFYSNGGYLILGYLIEEVLGRSSDKSYSWKDYVLKNILVPLGMKKTRFYWPEYKTGNKIREYNEKSYIQNTKWLAALPEDRIGIPRFIPKPGKPPIKTATHNLRVSVGGSAGTLKSSAEDLSKFMTVLLNNGTGYKRDEKGNIIGRVHILSDSSIKEMMTLFNTDMNMEYGMGWYKMNYGGRYWTSVWNPDRTNTEDPDNRVNWGDKIHPAKGSLRYAGFEPADLSKGKGLTVYGHDGGTGGAVAMMLHVPNRNLDNDVALIFFRNELFGQENRDESQIQPDKFKHYKTHYEGGKEVVAQVAFNEGKGALPHDTIKNSELLHILLHKAASIIEYSKD